MNRYLRFKPVDGEPNTVALSLGDATSPQGVELCALERLRVLLTTRRIQKGCRFVCDQDAKLPATPDMIALVIRSLFPTALQRLEGRP